MNILRLRLVSAGTATAIAVLGGTGLASAAFLCPVVSDSVASVADVNNGDNGVSVIEPPVGTSFLPGNNQAGDNADSNAYNAEGPGNPDAGPGLNSEGDGNSDFSPIWP